MSTNPIVPLPPAEVAPAQMVPVSMRPQAVEIAAWALLAALLMFVLFEHLVSAAVVALALYGILEGVTKRMSRRLGSTARPLAVVVVTMLPAGVVVGAIALMVTIIRHGASNIPDMINQIAEISCSAQMRILLPPHDIFPLVIYDADSLTC